MVDESSRIYSMGREKNRALDELDALLSQAKSEGIHEKIGLREPIELSPLEERKNNRDLVVGALKNYVATNEAHGETEEILLMRQIVQGILKAGAIIEELERNPRPSDEPPKSTRASGKKEDAA